MRALRRPAWLCSGMGITAPSGVSTCFPSRSRQAIAKLRHFHSLLPALDCRARTQSPAIERRTSFASSVTPSCEARVSSASVMPSDTCVRWRFAPGALGSGASLTSELSCPSTHDWGDAVAAQLDLLNKHFSSAVSNSGAFGYLEFDN